MLRVTIELLPHGSEARKSHLGTVLIANDGTASDGSGDAPRGNYVVRLSRRGQPLRVWRTGVVRDFPRKRLGAYDLLLRALVATVGERNK